MSNISLYESFELPKEVNFVAQGAGKPVILIHGLAASLHDWDALIPALVEAGHAAYALDLLGHGDSPKPAERGYLMEWIVDHFLGWLDSLQLDQPVVLVGHSLGGYLALDFARRFPKRTRGLVLVDPFYSKAQLPTSARLAYGHPRASAYMIEHSPRWIVRSAIDLMSATMGHATYGAHALSKEVREQTALDYFRTAPGAYNILSRELDLTPYLSTLSMPALVVWGERDQTLRPASFTELVHLLPRGRGKSIATGHVPHQAYADWFNALVLEFLRSTDTLRDS